LNIVKEGLVMCLIGWLTLIYILDTSLQDNRNRIAFDVNIPAPA